jgi:hypothetical protein
MAVLIVLVLFIALDIAAWCWGVDSRDPFRHTPTRENLPRPQIRVTRRCTIALLMAAGSNRPVDNGALVGIC